MNSIITVGSLASATAVGTPAGFADAAKAALPPALSKDAVIARAEQIVNVLSDCAVCDGWHEHFDQQRAMEFLDAVRKEDWSANGDEASPVAHVWMRDHGQSFEWLYDGDPVGPICRAAARSPVAAGLPTGSDPIFSAIEKHKSALQVHVKAIYDHSALDESLPRELRQTNINAHGRKIVATDDPRWIAAEEALDRTANDMYDAAIEISGLEPRTLQGAAAVLKYLADCMTHYGDITGWPSYLLPDGVDDDDEGAEEAVRGPEYFVLQNVAASLARLA